MRIDQLLSHMKYGSRKEIQKILKHHIITSNGVRIESVKTHVNPDSDQIAIDGQVIFYRFPIDLVFYKPKGYLSANRDPKYPCVTEWIKPPFDRFDFSIAGRLDLDAEGLLILTTDGHFVHEITHPNKHLPKIYEVVLDKDFHHHGTLLNGVVIKDGHQKDFIAKALSISSIGNHAIISIDEGKFHQVKRMFLSVGYQVLQLKRTQIGNLRLNGLRPGEYRMFERSELYL